MNKTPPLLPEETLARLVRVARFDGLGVLIVAGLFAIAGGSVGDKLGVIVGLLAAGAGAIELHGINEIQRGEPRGMRWLMLSQIALLLTILGYCTYRFTHVDLTQVMQAVDQEMKVKIEMAGFVVEDFVRKIYFLTYTLVAIASTVYALVLFLYYFRRRHAVEAALAPEIETI